MIFTINGQDVTQYLKFGGIKYKRNDIDGPNAGRGLDGTLIRDRVAQKGRWDCTTYPMPKAKAETLLTLINPEWLTLQTDFNTTGNLTTYTVYSNNIETPFLMYRKNGVEWVDSFTFPIIEK